MSNSNDDNGVMAALLGGTVEVGGVALFPLSAGRVALLQSWGNVIISGAAEEADAVSETDLFYGMGEVLYVLRHSGAVLAGLSVLAKDRALVKGREWIMDVPQAEIEEFAGLWSGEVAALEQSAAEPAKQQAMGKRKRSRAGKRSK